MNGEISNRFDKLQPRKSMGKDQQQIRQDKQQMNSKFDTPERSGQMNNNFSEILVRYVATIQQGNKGRHKWCEERYHSISQEMKFGFGHTEEVSE